MNTRCDRKTKAKRARRNERTEELVELPRTLARRLRRRLGSARRERRRTTGPTLHRFLTRALPGLRGETASQLANN